MMVVFRFTIHRRDCPIVLPIWKRLLFWRDRLLHLRHSSPAWPLYEAFKTEISLMPREAVVAAATDGRLWNLRSGSAGESAAA